MAAYVERMDNKRILRPLLKVKSEVNDHLECPEINERTQAITLVTPCPISKIIGYNRSRKKSGDEGKARHRTAASSQSENAVGLIVSEAPKPDDETFSYFGRSKCR